MRLAGRRSGRDVIEFVTVFESFGSTLLERFDGKDKADDEKGDSQDLDSSRRERDSGDHQDKAENHRGKPSQLDDNPREQTDGESDDPPKERKHCANLF